MNMYVPNPLRTYTQGQAIITANGSTFGAVLNDIERQFPGIRFRMVNERNEIREHIKVFAGEQQIRDLDTPVAGPDSIHIICALSGGLALSGGH
jgi:molybdopterin converting factor small subunit